MNSGNRCLDENTGMENRVILMPTMKSTIVLGKSGSSIGRSINIWYSLIKLQIAEVEALLVKEKINPTKTQSKIAVKAKIMAVFTDFEAPI